MTRVEELNSESTNYRVWGFYLAFFTSLVFILYQYGPFIAITNNSDELNILGFLAVVIALTICTIPSIIAWKDRDVGPMKSEEKLSVNTLFICTVCYLGIGYSIFAIVGEFHPNLLVFLTFPLGFLISKKYSEIKIG